MALFAQIYEIIECDTCGFNERFGCEAEADRAGWEFTSFGTMCPECAERLFG